MIFSYLLNMQSHPSWVCGLKQDVEVFCEVGAEVTPFVGVWIETANSSTFGRQLKVTPFVGVWIETASNLKVKPGSEVTPFVGVWIETYHTN